MQLYGVRTLSDRQQWVTTRCHQATSELTSSSTTHNVPEYDYKHRCKHFCNGLKTLQRFLFIKKSTGASVSLVVSRIIAEKNTYMYTSCSLITTTSMFILVPNKSLESILISCFFTNIKIRQCLTVSFSECLSQHSSDTTNCAVSLLTSKLEASTLHATRLLF